MSNISFLENRIKTIKIEMSFCLSREEETRRFWGLTQELKRCEKRLRNEKNKEMVRASKNKPNENSQNQILTNKQASFEAKKGNSKQLNAKLRGSRL